ncbi:hypothetical protein Tco_1011549 [Tanacetum coccineum]
MVLATGFGSAGSKCSIIIIPLQLDCRMDLLDPPRISPLGPYQGRNPGISMVTIVKVAACYGSSGSGSNIGDGGAS